MKRLLLIAILCLKTLSLSAAELEYSLTPEKGLFVTMKTERLVIRSLDEQDQEAVVSLFTDPVVMEKFATGVRTVEASIARVHTFCGRWHMMNPFSALTISLVEDPQTIIGLIALSASENPGSAEISFLLFHPFWNQGYGKEATTAMVRDYAKWLIHQGLSPDGHPLMEIVATARPDNPASIKILEGLGMIMVGTSEKYGAERYHFSLRLDLGLGNP